MTTYSLKLGLAEYLQSLNEKISQVYVVGIGQMWVNRQN